MNGKKHDKGKAVYTGDVGYSNRQGLVSLFTVFFAKKELTEAVLAFIYYGYNEFRAIETFNRFFRLLRTKNSRLEIHLAFIALIRHGAKKYGIGNWRLVDNAIERYTNALCRHVEEWVLADDVNCLDKDSGLPVYAHIIANCIFLSKLLRSKNV